MRFNNLIIIS